MPKSPSAETEDRHYRTRVAAIEPYGVDHIPDAERHGTARSQFSIWFAAGLNFPIMVLGFSAVSYGLSLTAAVTAIVAGSLIGAVVQGVLSQMGARLGVPQQIQARGPLGFFGNFVPVAYINVFAGIGWAAVTIILGAQALHHLVPGVPFWLTALILVTVQLVVAVFGYNMIHFLQKILSVVLFFGFVLITVVSVVRGDALNFDANPAAPFYLGATGGWITFAGFFMSFLIAWWPFASDYSRYLPDDDTTARRAGGYTLAGNFLTLTWLGIAGALLGGSAIAGEEPIQALARLTGPWAPVALVIVMISSFSQNFLNVYGGAISVQTLRIPVSRRTAVVVICVAAYLISLWAGAGFEAKFKNFLFLGAYLIAPFGAALLLDYFVGGRKDKSRIPELYDETRLVNWGFFAWLAGVVASVPFWNLSFYRGWVTVHHPEWGDLTYFAGFAVAVVVYLLTYRLPGIRRRGAPSSDAAVPVESAVVGGEERP
ncbi:cytosine permease [Amycolatopsis acidiphila]|uniref:Cytosine permease n=1 Tax=Amycolatopsis acidiphila TaxID=715473 RepID=A0A558AJ92_9PSEU|nr:cytosine permease [Amycolatopsis acidiphila]TVT24271.1 cytosine permease [Amycolatopsis acidiphila]UIJ62599.1 cytosine permease [Amycolatopsis acidiphila]GHG85675.1 cytosine permease [Amycolatopsis acidiphila]